MTFIFGSCNPNASNTVTERGLPRCFQSNGVFSRAWLSYFISKSFFIHKNYSKFAATHNVVPVIWASFHRKIICAWKKPSSTFCHPTMVTRCASVMIPCKFGLKTVCGSNNGRGSLGYYHSINVCLATSSFTITLLFWVSVKVRRLWKFFLSFQKKLWAEHRFACSEWHQRSFLWNRRKSLRSAYPNEKTHSQRMRITIGAIDGGVSGEVMSLSFAEDRSIFYGEQYEIEELGVFLFGRQICWRCIPSSRGSLIIEENGNV